MVSPFFSDFYSAAGNIDFGTEFSSKAWKDIWSAGQGVGAIDSVVTTKELVQQLKKEYDTAVRRLFEE